MSAGLPSGWGTGRVHNTRDANTVRQEQQRESEKLRAAKWRRQQFRRTILNRFRWFIRA